MTNLRTIVIAKTDIVDFTPKIANLSESELSTLLDRHKRFISDIVNKNEGSIIKGEGDSFWIVFPSVTIAALAAIEVHQSLRLMEAGRGDDKRLAIRVAITVGDALVQDNDIFGNIVNLTARIESITPPDEIYLSHAAWLILNKAELQTSYVNQFTLKGFQEPEKIYKVEKRHRTRVITDQIIVFTDVRAWVPFMKSNTIAEIESILLEYDNLINKICNEYGGLIRNVAGEVYVLTFYEVPPALMAMEKLCQQWSNIFERYEMGLAIGIHKGNINVLRSYIFSDDVSVAALLMSIIPTIFPEKDQSSILISKKVAEEIQEAKWKRRLKKIDSGNVESNYFQSFIEEYGTYQLIMEN